MSLGMSLGAFAEGFAGSHGAKKEREAQAKAGARQDRWLDLVEKNPSMLSGGGMAMGAVPNMSGEGGGSGGAVASASMPTGTTADYVRAGLVKRGMAQHLADGFALNFGDESSFNTSAVGDSGSSFGLAQWQGPRKEAMQAYAMKNNRPAHDTDVQLDYLMQELQGPEASAWKKIQAAASPGAAAAAIVNHFERPAEVHRAAREKKYLAYGAGPMGANRPVY